MGRGRRARVRPWMVGVLVVAVAGAGFGLYWFQPWKLWQDETVQEALPVIVEVPKTPAEAPPSGESSAPAPAGPVTLASGELISHEHTTSGAVKLVRPADAPVEEGRAGWRVFDDGDHVSLGKLKGNKGSQNYTVPEDIDPARYSSVSIWCDRFDVSFGAAELARG